MLLERGQFSGRRYGGYDKSVVARSNRPRCGPYLRLKKVSIRLRQRDMYQRCAARFNNTRMNSGVAAFRFGKKLRVERHRPVAIRNDTRRRTQGNRGQIAARRPPAFPGRIESYRKFVPGCRQLGRLH